jgi:DNA modification methylase
MSDPFLTTPEDESFDGGTTSSGHLWHSVTPRWGHSMHSMCSYHGMFPAKVAHYFIQRFSRPGGVVLDPFSGRGTTGLQAQVEGRFPVCNDLNPLAHVLSRAKVCPPSWGAAMQWLADAERDYQTQAKTDSSVSPDIRMLYHANTLRQLCFLRERFLANPVTEWSNEQAMVAGALAGIMHGAWRRDGSSQYLSISMPNTFSMAPGYVRKFIRENGLQKIDQDVFERLRDKLARLYLDDVKGLDGDAHHANAVTLLSDGCVAPGSVDLIVTSPPYLQVVNYGTANWIRLWLLGMDGVARDGGVGRKHLNAVLDHQHTYTSYREFLLCVFHGIERVLKPNGVAAVVIGDVADPGKKPIPLAAQVWKEMGQDTNLRLVDLIEDDLPVQTKVSRIWGDTRGQATSRDCVLVLAHRDAEIEVDDLGVSWDEPYKDAGPDAAHERVEAIRYGYS